jgi:hypothetical protein
MSDGYWPFSQWADYDGERNPCFSLMSITATDTLTLSIERLPLAVYYEIAAHLQQLSGIQVEILPQTAPNFDYLQSQVGGISINCSKLSVVDRTKADEILDYYHQRYGATKYHQP